MGGGIDSAIEHIPQLEAEEQRRLAHDTTLGPWTAAPRLGGSRGADRVRSRTGPLCAGSVALRGAGPAQKGPVAVLVPIRRRGGMTREYLEVRRIFNGFYWRGQDPRDGGLFADYGHMAIAYGGAGSGFAGASAVNRLGWSTQVPARARVAVVGRAPEARHSAIRFVSRSNAHRRDLTWAEVTLLEGIRSVALAEPAFIDWEQEDDQERKEVQGPLQDAVDRTTPRLVFHGHWHQTNHEDIRDGDTEVFGLNRDGHAGCIAVLDLAGDGPWSGLVALGGGGKGAGAEPGGIDEVVHSS